MDNNWILAFRADYLTGFFKFFPLLASDYFYIAVVALGYWRYPKAITFKSLGFIIPFSTLLNCLIKNCFQIPRPDIGLHLIQVADSFGFPSGDVQVAVVFWGYIFTVLGKTKLKYLAWLPVIGIGLSRIYLGVHSFTDVIGALVVGLATLQVWCKYTERSLLKPVSNYKLLWILIGSITGLFIIVSPQLRWPPVASVAIGVLIGYGIAFKAITAPTQPRAMSLLHTIIAFSVIIIAALGIPVIKTNELAMRFTVALKYMVITLGIFYILPKIHQRINSTIK